MVVSGEDAVNIIQQKTAVAPIVEVRDRNNLPVAGATVTFSIASTGTASFPGGISVLTATTNAAGRAAAVAVNPLASGAVQIQVTALAQGQTAVATIVQSNVMTAAQAAAAAGASSASSSGSAAGGTAASGGGGISGTTIGIIGGAVGAAGIAGVALTRGGDDGPVAQPNRAPTVVSSTASPATALQGATSVAFTASASDLDNDVLTYVWDFGDGSTANTASASHTYQSPGTFTARLTVTDTRGLSASGQTSVTVRNVTGRWAGVWTCTTPDASCNGGLQVSVTIDAQQSGSTVTGSSTVRFGTGVVYNCAIGGRVEAPRRVIFADNVPCPNIGPQWFERWRGDLDEALNRADITYSNGPFYIIRQ